jgi:hypothetical protein
MRGVISLNDVQLNYLKRGTILNLPLPYYYYRNVEVNSAIVFSLEPPVISVSLDSLYVTSVLILFCFGLALSTVRLLSFRNKMKWICLSFFLSFEYKMLTLFVFYFIPLWLAEMIYVEGKNDSKLWSKDFAEGNSRNQIYQPGILPGGPEGYSEKPQQTGQSRRTDSNPEPPE